MISKREFMLKRCKVNSVFTAIKLGKKYWVTKETTNAKRSVTNQDLHASTFKVLTTLLSLLLDTSSSMTASSLAAGALSATVALRFVAGIFQRCLALRQWTSWISWRYAVTSRYTDANIRRKEMLHPYSLSARVVRMNVQKKVYTYEQKIRRIKKTKR